MSVDNRFSGPAYQIPSGKTESAILLAYMRAQNKYTLERLKAMYEADIEANLDTVCRQRALAAVNIALDEMGKV